MGGPLSCYVLAGEGKRIFISATLKTQVFLFSS